MYAFVSNILYRIDYDSKTQIHELLLLLLCKMNNINV